MLLLHEFDRMAPGRFAVSGARARHLVQTLGVDVGRRVRAGLLEGAVGEAEVLSVEPDRVELHAQLEGAPPPRPRVDLILAIPRPKMLRRLLPQIAAIGVDRLVLLRTWRVEKPYLSASILQPEAYRALLHDGLAQARCTREPRVTIEPLFRPFVEDRAAALLTDGALGLVAHPGGAHPLEQVLDSGAARRAVLAIGPEGGFLPFEIELLTAAGLRLVGLGPRILRTDTACIAALAAAAAVFMLTGKRVLPGVVVGVLIIGGATYLRSFPG